MKHSSFSVKHQILFTLQMFKIDLLTFIIFCNECKLNYCCKTSYTKGCYRYKSASWSMSEKYIVISCKSSDFYLFIRRESINCFKVRTPFNVSLGKNESKWCEEETLTWHPCPVQNLDNIYLRNTTLSVHLGVAQRRSLKREGT